MKKFKHQTIFAITSKSINESEGVLYQIRGIQLTRPGNQAYSFTINTVDSTAWSSIEETSRQSRFVED